MAPSGPTESARAAILAAAADLFATKGYSATTISDIAAAAGANRALVSYHFGGKAGLYDAILDEAVGEAAAQLDAADLGASEAPERRLIAIFAEVLSSRPYLAPMIMREHLDPNHLLDPVAANRLRGFMALTERALALVPLGPKARRFDPQVVHLICIGPLVHFLIAQRQREATADQLARPVSKPSLEALVATLAEILSRGLRG